jgi:hypothetical protein
LQALLKTSDRADRAALGDHIASAAFAATALGGDTEFKLDLVKAHAGAGMADDVTVGDTVANTDDHGGVSVRVGSITAIINTNDSYLQAGAS